MKNKKTGRFAKGFEPHNKIKLSEKETNLIINLYKNQGKTFFEIGKIFSHSKSLIKRILLENKIKIRNTRESVLFGKPKPSKIVELYKKGTSINELQKKFHLGEKEIKRILNELEIKIRNQKEATELARRQGKYPKYKIPSKKELEYHYHKSGFSTQDIANIYGIKSKTVVNRWLTDYNISKRKPLFGPRKKIVTRDGHRVRSSYERIVCEWLYENNILHEVEPFSIRDRKKRADFKVGRFYIEVLGMLNLKTYKKRYENKLTEMAFHYGPGFAFFKGEDADKYLKIIPKDMPVIVEIIPNKNNLTKLDLEKQLSFLKNVT